MRRVIVSALALALLPAAAFAQQPPTQEPPTQQPPTQQPPAQTAPAQPAEPKIGFKSNAGMLLVQVKPDGTSAFEELMSKLKSQLEGASDPALKSQANFKVYKSTEGSGGNALYVVVIDPAVPGAEYNFLDMYNKTLTPEEQRDPAMVENFKRWASAFAGMNILNLSPVTGGAQ